MSRLTIVVYEGWDDPEATAAFRSGGTEVNAVYVDNDTDLLAAMRDGVGEIDLVCIDNRFTRIGIADGTIVPLDYGRIPNAGLYLDRFAEIAHELFDGTTWSAPYVWGTCPLAYNAAYVDEPPPSVLDFAAPEYAGRVVVRDEPYNQIVVFARALGIEDPVRMTRHDLDRVVEAILDLRARTGAPVLALEALYDLLCSGEAWLSTSAGWEGVARVASERGVDVRPYHPAAGDHAWLDAWCLLRDAPDPDAAYAWIDCVLATEAQRIVCDKLPAGPVNREAAALLSADVRATFPAEDVGRIFSRPADVDLPPLEADGDVATLADWRAAWERVRNTTPDRPTPIGGP